MPEVRIVGSDEAPLDDLRALFDAAFGDRFSDDDFEHGLGGAHVLVTDGPEVVAHAAVVRRAIHVGERAYACGYVENVATLPARQRSGLGRLAMEVANGVVRADHELGALSTSSWRFYEGLGWERWRGPSYVLGALDGIRRRTPDEDEGIMVLRFGPSAGADLASPIACVERFGDDW